MRSLLLAAALAVAACATTPPAETFRRSCETAAIAAADVAQAYLDHRIGADAFRAARISWQATKSTCEQHPAFDAQANDIATTQVMAFIGAAAALTGQEYADE